VRCEIVLLKSTCRNWSLYAAQPSAVSCLTLQQQQQFEAGADIDRCVHAWLGMLNSAVAIIGGWHVF